MPPRAESARAGAVIVLCDERGRVALQLRDDVPGVADRGHWGLFGGWLEGAETPTAGALRELGEELGLRLDAADLVALGQHVIEPPHGYLQASGAPIVVHVFSAVIAAHALPERPAEGTLAAWHDPQAARALPTVPHHQQILDAFTAPRAGK